MAKITKHVDRAIPVTERTQEFVGADAVEGDVLMIKESLGKNASSARLRTIGGSVKLRFNVYQTVFKKRGLDGFNREDTYNLTSGFEYKVTEPSAGDLIIEADTTYELYRRFPIKDIELVTVSGDFNFFFA